MKKIINYLTNIKLLVLLGGAAFITGCNSQSGSLGVSERRSQYMNAEDSFRLEEPTMPAAAFENAPQLGLKELQEKVGKATQDLITGCEKIEKIHQEAIAEATARKERIDLKIGATSDKLARRLKTWLTEQNKLKKKDERKLSPNIFWGCVKGYQQKFKKIKENKFKNLPRFEKNVHKHFPELDRLKILLHRQSQELIRAQFVPQDLDKLSEAVEELVEGVEFWFSKFSKEIDDYKEAYLDREIRLKLTLDKLSQDILDRKPIEKKSHRK